MHFTLGRVFKHSSLAFAIMKRTLGDEQRPIEIRPRSVVALWLVNVRTVNAILNTTTTTTHASTHAVKLEFVDIGLGSQWRIDVAFYSNTVVLFFQMNSIRISSSPWSQLSTDFGLCRDYFQFRWFCEFSCFVLLFSGFGVFDAIWCSISVASFECGNFKNFLCGFGATLLVK